MSFGLFLVPVEDHPEEASVEPEQGTGKRGGFASEVGDALPQGVVSAFDFAGVSLTARSRTQLKRTRGKELFIDRVSVGEDQKASPLGGHLLP